VLPVANREQSFVAIDSHGRRHFLLQLGDDGEQVPASLSTLNVSVRPLVVDGESVRVLDLACLLEAVAEVFDHFVSAVLEHLDREPLAPRTKVVSDVLERWRLFLIPGDKPAGRDTLASLFGELLAVADVVAAAPAHGLDAWVGPAGARHDLRRGPVAMEVKSTRAHTSRQITIHGADQLDAPDEGLLYLHFVRLEEVPAGGESVATLVDRLLTAGVSAEGLYAGVSASGVSITDLPATASVCFEVRERFTIRVDDSTPRIIPASFVDRAVPTGVVDLNYAIDLDHVSNRAISQDDYRRLSETLGGRE
jgi:hypothetical protein